jgi:acetyl coenzyme A synthetase (ADP forming)-like protein
MGIYEDLRPLFHPRTVAIIGAGREKHKIGHIIFKDFVENFKGKTFAINPNARRILGHKCYPGVNAVKEHIDVAVFAIPARIVPKVMEECVQKGVKVAIIISGGFGEIGRKDLEEQTLAAARKGGIRIIGPNCLGIFDSHDLFDTLFLPRDKLQRPKSGKISFISQSGAVGSVVLDWAAGEGFGVSKFISYGNAIDLDESDLLEYLMHDKETKVICVYLEGVRDGRKMMKIARQVVKKKPIIVIKGGRTEEGSSAVSSHTGSLAGSDMVYHAAFKQCGMIRADTVTEMFDYARILCEQPSAGGDRIQVMTNGGGFGVLATDAIIQESLKLAEMEDKTRKHIRKHSPEYAVVSNPLDLVGDADPPRYKAALDALGKDKNIDAILCITLFQTLGMRKEIVDVLINFSDKRLKPIAVCAAGADYTKSQTKILESHGVPTFDSPSRAAHALWCLVQYGHILKEGV